MSVVEIGRYEYCTIGTYCTVFIKLNKSVSSRILQNIFNKILLTDSNRFARIHLLFIHIYFLGRTIMGFNPLPGGVLYCKLC